MFRPTIKKDADGFPQHRLHITDAGGDRLLIELDVEETGVVFNAGDFQYLEFTPEQLVRIAEWAKRAWVQLDAWRQSDEGQAYLDRIS